MRKFTPLGALAVAAITLAACAAPAAPAAPAATTAPAAEQKPASGLPDLGGREISIAIENAYIPFNYVRLDNGQAEGWDYDALAEICKRFAARQTKKAAQTEIPRQESPIQCPCRTTGDVVAC